MNDWYIVVPTVCGAIATTVPLWRKEWSIAIAMGCISMFILFNTLLLNVVPAPVKYVFFFVGATLIAVDIARTYKKYKASL
jgi:hypothetical protein